MVMGQAWYTATFLVGDTLAHDYMLGLPFMLQYNLQLKSHHKSFAIGLPVRNLLVKPTKTPVNRYQVLPISFRTKQLAVPVVGLDF